MSESIQILAKNTEGTVTNTVVNTVNNGGPVIIKAENGVKYELRDMGTKVAPEQLLLSRDGNNLVIKLNLNEEVADGEEAIADIVIENYFATEIACELVGLAENGEYYELLPEDGMADGDAVFSGLSAIFDSEAGPAAGFGWVPYALGAAAAGGVAVASGVGSNDSSSTAVIEPEEEVVISEEVISPLSAPVITFNQDANNDGLLNQYELDGAVSVRMELPSGVLVNNVLSVSDGDESKLITLTEEDITKGYVDVSFIAPPEGEMISVTALIVNGSVESGQSASKYAVIDTRADANNNDFTVTVDNIADDSAVVGDFITNENQVIINGRIDTEDKTSLSVAVGGNIYTVDNQELSVDENGNWSLDLTSVSLEDGTYTIVSAATDSAGNIASSSQSITIDTTAPVISANIDAISLDSGVAADFITNKTTGLVVSATLSDVLSADDVLLYSSDNGITWDDITSSVVGTSVSYEDLGLASTSTIQLQVSDSAGNTGEAASQLITIDSLIDQDKDLHTVTIDGIATDTGVSGDFVTKEIGSTLYGTIDLDDNSILTVDFNGDVYTTENPNLTVDENGNWELNLGTTIYEDGTYVVIASVTDIAGNTSSVTQNIVVDSLIDADKDLHTATIDSISVDSGTDGDFITNEPNVVVYGTVDLDDDVSFSVVVNEIPYVIGEDLELYIDESGNWSLDMTGFALNEGSNEVVVTVADLAGNTVSTSKNIVFHRTADNDGDLETVSIGNISIDSNIEDDFVTNDNTLLVAGKVDLDDANVFSVSFNGTSYTTENQELSVDTDGNWVLDLSAIPLADGTYEVVSTIVDVAGNSKNATQSVLVDTTVDTNSNSSTVSISSITNDTHTLGDFITNDNTLVINGTVDLEDGNDFTVSVNEVSYTSDSSQLTIDESGNWYLDLSSSAPKDGTYEVVASVSDLAGNTYSSSQSIVVDTFIDQDNDKETITIKSISDDSSIPGDFITNDQTLTISGIVDLDDDCELSITINGSTYTASSSELTVSESGKWTLDLTDTVLEDGTYSLVATMTDLAGNAKSVSENVVINTSVVSNSAPVVEDSAIRALSEDDFVGSFKVITQAEVYKMLKTTDINTNDIISVHGVAESSTFNLNGTGAVNGSNDGVFQLEDGDVEYFGLDPEIYSVGDFFVYSTTFEDMNEGDITEVQFKVVVFDGTEYSEPATLSFTVSGTNDVILEGTDEANVLVGTSDSENIYGYDGDDDINGGEGNDRIDGGEGNDIINGGAGNDVLLGGNGDDNLIDGDGSDTFNGGGGNDTISISGAVFSSINGGEGDDTLFINGGFDFDLSLIDDTKITSIENIDLNNGEANTLSLSYDDLLSLNGSGTLFIQGDNQDSVAVGGGTFLGSEIINEVTYNTYDIGGTSAADIWVQQDITVL